MLVPLPLVAMGILMELIFSGMSTAMMGKEAAMACTEAVEDVISEHYNDQLRELMEQHPEDTELRDVFLPQNFC